MNDCILSALFPLSLLLFLLLPLPSSLHHISSLPHPHRHIGRSVGRSSNASYDLLDGSWVARTGTRVSLTFRTVRGRACECPPQFLLQCDWHGGHALATAAAAAASSSSSLSASSSAATTTTTSSRAMGYGWLSHNRHLRVCVGVGVGAFQDSIATANVS
jgi:hypothetical protein